MYVYVCALYVYECVYYICVICIYVFDRPIGQVRLEFNFMSSYQRFKK